MYRAQFKKLKERSCEEVDGEEGKEKLNIREVYGKKLDGLEGEEELSTDSVRFT